MLYLILCLKEGKTSDALMWQIQGARWIVTKSFVAREEHNDANVLFSELININWFLWSSKLYSHVISEFKKLTIHFRSDLAETPISV